MSPYGHDYMLLCQNCQYVKGVFEMEQKKSRKEKAADTKRKIFETAAGLIRQKGYAQVTVSEICRAAGSENCLRAKWRDVPGAHAPRFSAYAMQVSSCPAYSAKASSSSRKRHHLLCFFPRGKIAEDYATGAGDFPSGAEETPRAVLPVQIADMMPCRSAHVRHIPQKQAPAPENG